MRWRTQGGNPEGDTAETSRRSKAETGERSSMAIRSDGIPASYTERQRAIRLL